MGKLFRVHPLSQRRAHSSCDEKIWVQRSGKGFPDTLMLIEPQSSYQPHKMQDPLYTWVERFIEWVCAVSSCELNVHSECEICLRG